MSSSRRMPIVFFLAFMISMLPLVVDADLIVLKDGTQVEAEKIWEENGLVRFSVPNYDGIVITYSKEIVERIVREHPKIENGSNRTKDKRPASPKSDTEVSSVNKNNLTVPPVAGDTSSPEGVSSVTPGSDTEIDKALVDSVAGIEFYSARRSFKYQTGPDSRFHTFKEAVDDLAARFDKDPYWIGQNLGNTNDLGQIYMNMSRSTEPMDAETEPQPTTSGILFYDPRRSYKYWVAADSKHQTLNEAIDSLAGQYARSPEWVIDHLGETNDLAEIHRNLEAGVNAETEP